MTYNKYVIYTVIKFLVFVMFWDKRLNFFKDVPRPFVS